MAASSYEGVDTHLSEDVDVPQPVATPWRRRAVAVACTLGTAAALMSLAARPRSGDRASRNEGFLVLSEDGGDAVDCSSPGENCANSKCCLDGGSGGYQCFAKNDDWAQCLESCKKGPHDETDGEYGADGEFHQFEWTCKKLGKKSKPGCDSYGSKKDCTSHEAKNRCSWTGGSCKIKCSVLPEGEACDSNDHCISNGGKCMAACGTYGKKECPTDRCVFKEDKCITACWSISDENTCKEAMWDSRACIWEDNQCKEDPCSAMDESCLDTKCCSAARGGQGKTCFKKDKYYGKCMDFCEEDGWECTQMGNRTKWDMGCTWIGSDCSDTHLCCQQGSACVVKDELFTGCIQTQKIGSWDSQDIPIPSDWKGTTLGGSRAEYEVQPASEGEEKAGAVLFCFMAYLPDSGEVPLKDMAESQGASIFQCDYHQVFESWSSEKHQWDTGGDGASIANTDVFINVWLQVKEDGQYLKADWTVKVDPDAVMVYDRLVSHIYGLNAPKDRPIYLKNNNMDKGLGNNGFLGAIEVFSKQAVQIYFDNYEGCREAYGLDSGEDGFFKGCMDAMGVGFMTDGNMFEPDFSPGACGNEGRAAFHPLKEPSQWLCCWQIIQGSVRDVKYGKCDMGPDGTGPAEEPQYGGVAR
jgi:hypothetical protein